MNLTDEQQAVVDLTTGRHLVLAPPGSGKTEMLSQRIFRAVRAGVAPERMLCATFTNRAAFEMRDRVRAEAGELALPDVGSLHHFCHRLLLSVGRLRPDKHVLDEVGQMELVKEVVDVLRTELRSGRSADLRRSHGVTVIGAIDGMCEPRAAFLREKVESFFAACIEKGKNPYMDFLAAVLVSRQRRIGIPTCYLRQMPPSMLEFCADGIISVVERVYTGLKRKFRSVDFDDLVNETYLFVTKTGIAEEDRFTWVQIDEVQDLNPMQWRIVRELTSVRAVSVYFGDVEQSIYSFLGASAVAFGTTVADCRRRYFRSNFRATPLLLEILMRYSLAVLRSEWEFLPAPFDLSRANGVIAMEGATSVGSVRNRIIGLLSTGVAEMVAILVRDNAAADLYESSVRGLGYRTVKVSGVDLFSYAPMRDFVAFVYLFCEKTPMTAWACLVRRFATGAWTRTVARYFVRGMIASGWRPLDLFAEKDPVAAFPFRRTRRSLWAWGHRKALRSLRERLRPAYERVTRKLNARCSMRDLFAEFACLALGEEARYSANEFWPERKLNQEEAARIPYEESRKHAIERIEIFLRYVDFTYRDEPRPMAQVLREDWQRLSRLKEADLLVGDEKIVVSTIHKAKGRQFDAVIVPDADGVVQGSGEEEQDEARRLLYVAISRAKRHLSLFGCNDESVWKWVKECFSPDYVNYYKRRGTGETKADDWLSCWEILAACLQRGDCPWPQIEASLAAKEEPIVRMALRVLRQCPDSERIRQTCWRFLSSETADEAIRSLSDCRQFDGETQSKVRMAVLETTSCRVAWAAFGYFRRAAREAEGANRQQVMAVVGGFLYLWQGRLRLEAAQLLAELGVSRWQTVITGSFADFKRLAAVGDPEQEDVIRSLLKVKRSDRYEQALRDILFRRARAAR